MKSLAPRGILNRFLIIVATTLFLTQTLFMYIFYDMYWREVKYALLKSLASNIAVIVNAANANPDIKNLEKIVKEAASYTKLSPQITVFAPPITNNTGKFLNKSSSSLYFYLKGMINNNIYINEYSSNYSILKLSIQIKDNYYISFYVEKELLFIASYQWLIILLFILYLVAILIILQFFRIQLRPLKKLVRASYKFARGEKTEYILPSGSMEIREATTAFNDMRENIERFIEQRTMMLSSISHDLKSSLTKMNLILDINDNKTINEDMKVEVTTMTNIVLSYLSFAKNDHIKEPKINVNIKNFIREIAEPFNTTTTISTVFNQNIKQIKVQPIALSRAITNIIENATKYGTKVVVKIQNLNYHSIIISIEDNGRGIPENKYQEVFKPFYMLNEARTPEKGSVGLGMFIVKEIITQHGGNIQLKKSKLGGLQVDIILPF